MDLESLERLIYIIRFDSVVKLLLSTGQLINLLVHEFDAKESLSREVTIVPLSFRPKVKQFLLEVESAYLALSSCL